MHRFRTYFSRFSSHSYLKKLSLSSFLLPPYSFKSSAAGGYRNFSFLIFPPCSDKIPD